MKKIVSLLLISSLLLSAVCAFSSCEKKTSDGAPAESAAEITDVSAEITDASAETDLSTDAESDEDYGSDFLTYGEAYRLFESLYGEKGHAGYLQYVYDEAEKVKLEAQSVHDEIIEILNDLYERIVVKAPIDISYEEFVEKAIDPFEEYYNARMELAGSDAYYGAASMKSLGGNSAGDAALLWKYVHYRNLYRELVDFKSFVDLYD